MIAPTPYFLAMGFYIFSINLANGKSLVVMSTSNYSPSKLNGNEGQKCKTLVQGSSILVQAWAN
jgi:hypothetical protein